MERVEKVQGFSNTTFYQRASLLQASISSDPPLHFIGCHINHVHFLFSRPLFQKTRFLITVCRREVSISTSVPFYLEFLRLLSLSTDPSTGKQIRGRKLRLSARHVCFNVQT